MVKLLCKTVQIPQKTKNRTTIQSINSTSGYFSEENKSTVSKRFMHTYVHYSRICIIPGKKQPKCRSIDEWIKKTWEIYIDINIMEYYSGIKKNTKVCLLQTWMDKQRTMLTKISQTEKDKYCMISLIFEI